MAQRQRKRRASNSAAAVNGSNGARYLYSDVMSLAGTLMRGQRQYGADKISSLATATRDFAEALPEMPNLRVYVGTAADRLEDLSGYVTRTELEDMIGDAGNFARRYPMAALGLAIAAGLGATRLLNAPSFSRPGAGRQSAPGSRRAKRRTRRSPARQAQSNA